MDNVNEIIDFSTQFAGILNTIVGFKGQLSALQAQVKSLERNVKKQMKALMKKKQRVNALHMCPLILF